MTRIHAPTLLAAALLAACTEPMDMSGYENNNDNNNSPAKNYFIGATTSHAHIYKRVAQIFSVYDLDTCTSAKDLATCQKVKGLKVTAFSRAPGETFYTDQALEAGRLEDAGDGTYHYYTQFGALGSHVVGLRFEEGGRQYFGAFALETSRGGGERYFCDSDGDSTTDHAYMIRWNGSSGHVMADDATEQTFTIELMRTLAGAPVNTVEPWTNKFDHLAPADLEGGAPVVKLVGGEAASAEELATLLPTYAGKGLYLVKRTFARTDVMDAMGRTFWLKISFQDKAGCTVDGSADPDNYYFPVVPKAGHEM